MKEKFKNSCLKMALIGLCAVAIMFGLSAGRVLAHEADPHPHAEDSKVADTKYKDSEHGSLADIGAKLSNPVSNLWGLSLSFNMPQYYDGDVNTGNPLRGATMVFQPLMPIPLFGSGKDQWRMIARPIIPLIFSQPIPTGFNEFDHDHGLGDIQHLPELLVESRIERPG